MADVDFIRYYYLEQYLFDNVSRRFVTDRNLSAFDFFCIVIWKANRAKSKVAHRLLAQGYQTLDEAVAALMRQLADSTSAKARLAILIQEWGFRLPMASAIATVLYPEQFTVYDVRVCEVLGDFQDAQYKTRFDALWDRYSAYIERVRADVPSKAALRDKDRYLWGKSFEAQLRRDVSRGFGERLDDADVEA